METRQSIPPLNSKANESDENLEWLKEGTRYVCRQAIGSLHENRVYEYEAFSADPLGDTRQYLFVDPEDDDPHGVELSGDMPTPIWKDYLIEDDV